MSDPILSALLERVEALQGSLARVASEQRASARQIEELCIELANERRGRTQPYYTTEQLRRLANRPTEKALYSWAKRNGIPSRGHNQWDRRYADEILGLARN